MTAQVLENLFVHEHNPREVIRQEYQLAKQHFREVCNSRIAGDPEHDRRFRDALDRQEAARDRYVALLTGWE